MAILKEHKMIKQKLSILFLVLASLCFGQEFKPRYQSNKSLDFKNYLNGVTCAYVVVDDKKYQFQEQMPNNIASDALSGLLSYLKEIGFDNVKYGKGDDIPKFPSICDMVYVRLLCEREGNTLKNITLYFVSCNRDVFDFTLLKNLTFNEDFSLYDSNTMSKYFHDIFMEMFNYKKDYSANNRLSLPSEITDWTDENLRSHFKNNGVDPIEGIYEKTTLTKTDSKYILGLIKIQNGYELIYLSGADYYLDWKEGEVKAKLTATATPNLFKADWKMGNKVVNPNAYISLESGLMNLVMQGRDQIIYLKLFPTSNDNITSARIGPASGTGFAVSSDGIIITNNHVVSGANSIKIRGINGNYSKTYHARIVVGDKNNDLAILKVDDKSFTSLGNIPFCINSKTSDVGSSVFLLGYPLRASMGDEIKLTNGIISSRSGYQGDVTSYQITAPVQPGNSGGPLFDTKGKLVGIVSAKLNGAENASYAIKTSYLLNLFELMPSPPKLSNFSAVADKPLTEQVKILKDYTYIIEVN